MTRRWNDRLALLNWRSSLVTIALVGMVVISALGAWQVRASWLEHQRAVEQTLDEHALYAARTFFEATVTENNVLRERSLAAVTGAAAYPDDHLTLDRFGAATARVLDRRIDYGTDPRRGFFRIDLGTGRYAATGAAALEGAERAIRDSLQARRTVLDTTQLPVQVVVRIDGMLTSVHAAIQRLASRRPVAIYGFTISWQQSFVPLMEPVLPRIPLLPPSLLAGLTERPAGDSRGDRPVVRLDTLVALRMIRPDGSVYWQSPTQFTSPASGVFHVRRGSSTMAFHASLHPELVTRLRRQLLDDDRRRLQLALPILSVLFAITAILHFRRERELVRARRDFVASVSHELRTPLAQIRMFSETLQLRREENEEERMRWLGIIGREARRLGDLVENILLFSHIDAARVRVEPERTDIGELVEEVVEAYVPIAEARRMRIVADAPSRIFAIVDPRALRQIVVNLVDNALKYGPAGQTVTVEVERNTRVARLAVIDEGPGVPKSERSRLWRPFVRLANAGSTIGGSGIGLAVVRSLVHQHGGTVAVEDADGGGARFVVTFPLHA